MGADQSRTGEEIRGKEMTSALVFRPLARLELTEAMEWYENQRPGLGFELKDEVNQLLVRIVSNPGQFRRVRGDIRRALLRRFPYAIHFAAEAQTIVVLAVFHGKRNPRHLEGRI